MAAQDGVRRHLLCRHWLSEASASPPGSGGGDLKVRYRDASSPDDAPRSAARGCIASFAGSTSPKTPLVDVGRPGDPHVHREVVCAGLSRRPPVRKSLSESEMRAQTAAASNRPPGADLGRSASRAPPRAEDPSSLSPGPGDRSTLGRARQHVEQAGQIRRHRRPEDVRTSRSMSK